MRHPTIQDLQWLLGQHEPPCISLYMPTLRNRPDHDQNPIRFKTLVRRTAELLAEIPKRDAETLMARLQRLDDEAWTHPRDGLAVFCSQDEVVAYQFSAAVPEIVVVADTFHTKPFVRYLNRNRPFYVLVLAGNSIALWHGDRAGMSPLDLTELPADLGAALGMQELAPQTASSGPPVRSNGPVYRGSGLETVENRDELERALRAIDRALWQYLRDERAPLIVAAVDSYHKIFRSVCRHPHLVEPGLVGNYEKFGADELHRAAWPLVAAIFDREIDETIDRFRGRRAAGRAEQSLEAIASAVVQGRVSDLLVPQDRQVWGLVDRHTGTLRLHAQQESAEDADILDDLAEMTWLRGGRVLVVPSDRMPAAAQAAAIYRY
jgi:Bacterial archaeo-eukaryotic release factor family 3